ncbi:tRNA(fMet)-specific endonuclease VapC [Aquisphaera giovannonii]|uniref:Ribonuclease VapC n=1 Tax=Aquisphaera giovannonii TaxID=406548 RepID=A0A5B9WFX7_9BACT|nr:PIN domain-containing protein [Aquisphaera giovannonii]QEH38800.1 tRNA(fMet)-specific endonuclease VapC [Aquisphaera giovannonii]
MFVLVDSGFLLRLLETSDPHHSTIRAAVRALRGRADNLVVAPQNLAEFWNVCTRPAAARGGLGLSIADAERRLRAIERLFRVIPDNPAAYPIWRRILISQAVRGVQVHDARLVALMQASGISHILTLNTIDFARYPGVVPIAPTSLVNPSPPPAPPAAP